MPYGKNIRQIVKYSRTANYGEIDEDYRFKNVRAGNPVQKKRIGLYTGLFVGGYRTQHYIYFRCGAWKTNSRNRKIDSPDQHSGAGSSGGKEIMAE